MRQHPLAMDALAPTVEALIRRLRQSSQRFTQVAEVGGDGIKGGVDGDGYIADCLSGRDKGWVVRRKKKASVSWGICLIHFLGSGVLLLSLLHCWYSMIGVGA